MKHFMKKSISMIMVMIMILAMTMVPAFAVPGPLAMLTLPSSDFTKIVNVGDPSFTLTVTGLDSSYQPAAVDGTKVSWSTSNASVATVSPASGSDTTTVTIAGGTGIAVITASYSVGGVASVTSNVVVEGTTTVSSVNNITVEAIDATTSTTLFTSTNITVNLSDFTSSDVVGGSMVNVLKKTPSVMTAIVASAKANSETFTIEYGGDYLSELAGLAAYYDYLTGTGAGWTYEITRSSVTTSPPFAPSIYELLPGDTVTFIYDTY